MIIARTACGARIFFSSKVKACSACSREEIDICQKELEEREMLNVEALEEP